MKTIKNLLKIAAIALASVTLCLCFSGCLGVDLMRNKQAFWNEDGSITFGEDKYILLPSTELLSVNADPTDVVYVTDPDVPVLLSDSYGTQFCRSMDGLFLEESFYLGNDDRRGLYCREDKHAEFLERIESGIVLDKYCFFYERFDEENFEFVDDCYIFSEKEEEMIEKTLEEGEASHMEEDERYIEKIDIRKCTEDGYFTRRAYYLCRYKTFYYVAKEVNYSDDLYETVYYRIGGEYVDIADNMFLVYGGAQEE